MTSTIREFDDLKIPLEDVLNATKNFADKNITGKGTFGIVYKGKLLRSGQLINIAARRLDRKYKQGDHEFWNEISMLSSLKHENIVSLIGFCNEEGEKVIVYHHYRKGSLLMHLSNESPTWIQRLKICIGVARALSYIHNENGHNHWVLHRNVNSSTILLDDKFEAKLSGFEYAIKYSAYQKNQVHLLDPIGAKGYMDPEITKTGGVTNKSDIYSFGVVLWEVLCGRKAYISNVDEDNRFLALLAKFHYENQTVDDIIHRYLRLQAYVTITMFAKVSYSCILNNRLLRPDLNTIIHELEMTLSAIISLKEQNAYMVCL